jgi:hypothetical protein
MDNNKMNPDAGNPVAGAMMVESALTVAQVDAANAVDEAQGSVGSGAECAFLGPNAPGNKGKP